MSQAVLILVRHGATDANLRRPPVLQGRRMDLELSELGRRQADALAEALAGAAVRGVYASPLTRAHQTATAIARHHALPVQTIEAITEADIGDWEGLCWEEIQRRWPLEYRAFQEDPSRTGYSNGEDFEQVRRRSAPALQTLADRHLGETFVAVGHNVVNRAVLTHWMGVPIRYARRIPQSNAGYSVVLFEDGSARVRTVNCACHLSGLLPKE